MSKSKQAAQAGERSIKYQPIDEIEVAALNPKRHDIDKLRASVKHHGFVEPMVVDERTGRLVAGHGRLETLRAMHAAGLEPPEGVQASGGKWLAPVLRGWASENDTQASAYLIASNRLVEAGGWDESALADLLNEISSEGYLEAAGHTDGSAAEVEEKARQAADVNAQASEAGIGDAYTRNIRIPIYEPKGECPKLEELTDESKRCELVNEINAAGLPDDVSRFLRLAADRHTKFHFRRIAEFYSHAPKEVQALFEKSGLVIIDFDAALENGFIRLTDRLGLIADIEGFVDEK